MFDEINITKKISIEINVPNDGQQQINQYKTAFDSLRDSVGGLARQLPEFANGMTAGLIAVGKELPNVVDSMVKLNKQNKELAENGQKPKSVLEQLGSSLFTWNTALSTAITLVITYGPKLLSFISRLFDSKKARDAAQALRDYKDVLNSYIQNISQERGQLETLLTIAKNTNLANGTRLEAIKKLNDLSPEYLRNLSLTNINTQEGTKAVNDYVTALQRRATIEANQSKLEELLTKREKLHESYEKAKKDAYYYRLHPKDATVTTLNAGSVTGTTTTNYYGARAEDDWSKKVEEDAALIKRITTIKNSLASQLGKLVSQPPALTPSDGKAYWDNELNKLETEYQHLDASSKDFKQKSKPIIDRINAINKILEAYVISPPSHHHKNGTDGNTGNNSTNNTTADTTQTTKSPEAKADKFPTSKVDTADADYIPDDLKAANDEYMDQQAQKMKTQALKTTQDIINGSNAIKAANRLKETQDRQERNKKRVTEAKQVAEQLAQDGLSVLQNSISQQSEAKINALEKDKAAELNNTSLTSTQKAVIQQKYQQQENQIRAKAFKEEQEISIAQAVINGAVAITKVTSQDGVLAALEIGAVVAETAAQVAKIASQKPPAYATGGLHYASDGRGGVLPGYSRTDNTNAFLRSGEGIVVSEAMREPWARNLVSAINVGFGGRDFSTTTTGRGFAVGGIFTDGGNANRYYNQPVNDNKNLANTIAYQMINNFPPVYVDVKDINNQQNILAQTINRVNL